VPRLFLINPDYEHFRYHIEAVHECGFSGVICPVCGVTRQTIGICYPAIDLSSLPYGERFLHPEIIPLDKFEAWKAEITPLLPVGALIRPATKFGPLVGTLTGSPGDISFVSYWHVLSEILSVQRLQERGIRGIVPARTQLTSRRKNAPELIEWQLELRGELADSAFDDIGPQPTCPGCGYRKQGPITRRIIKEETIPSDLDIFRVRNAPTHVFVSGAFVDAVQALELTGLKISEVEIQPGSE
jgi:uncharacterized double-CXXCG motif protein